MQVGQRRIGKEKLGGAEIDTKGGERQNSRTYSADCLGETMYRRCCGCFGLESRRGSRVERVRRQQGRRNKPGLVYSRAGRLWDLLKRAGLQRSSMQWSTGIGGLKSESNRL